MLHRFPDAREIVEAVREFLEHEVMPGTTGALSFHARVAANLLGALERELAEGPEPQARYADLLAGLGVRDEAELAEWIRTGRIGADDPRLLPSLLSITTDRLLAWNPRYLAAEIDDDPRTTAQ
ncbi:DUF6285 domain-containing protein [Blastococcus sp. SYSU DS0539]